MRLFLDTANIDMIKQGVAWGVIDGVTTNPTIVAKEGISDYESVIKQICDIVPGEVSAEVTSVKKAEMIRQGKKIAKWHENVVVKVPCTPDGFEVTTALVKAGIKVNMTLCFTANQALLAALAGAYFISPFLGRLDDISTNGMDLIYDIREVYDAGGFDTQIIAASIRHPMHVIEAAKAGADVATIPYKVLEQMMKHPLTDAGQAKFMEDWRKVSNT